MTTKTGKAIAEHRHEVMENSLKNLSKSGIVYYNITILFEK